ncbi:MAG TPA: iron-sulfur cluster insertion protein ErpA [Ferrovibrio sp.]|uniref:iron-sulfur cluster insertion protein ErpA n=1 Tax=Ferrovibrio sp. TaxID=1917215 RepID=UPI002ED51382
MSETAAQTSASSAPTEAGGEPLRVTESAARQIRKVAAAEGNPALALRISVSGGGCSGFQYGFTLDEAETADDIVLTRDGARVLVDTVSLEYLRGSQIDFVEDLTGAYFRISNPQATSSCGCGNSFSM